MLIFTEIIQKLLEAGLFLGLESDFVGGFAALPGGKWLPK